MQGGASQLSQPVVAPPLAGSAGPAGSAAGLEDPFFLPPPGQAAAMEVPCGPGDAAVECLLLTELQAEDLPALRLTLVPLGVVHNSLPVHLHFQASLLVPCSCCFPEVERQL